MTLSPKGRPEPCRKLRPARFSPAVCHAEAPKPPEPARNGTVAPGSQQDLDSLPISLVPQVFSSPSVPTRHALYHRGFALEIRRVRTGYAFAIAQDEFPLHSSRPDYATPQSADRAARRFVDDALGAYDYATQAVEA